MKGDAFLGKEVSSAHIFVWLCHRLDILQYILFGNLLYMATKGFSASVCSVVILTQLLSLTVHKRVVVREGSD